METDYGQWLGAARTDPIRHVEELSILENRSGSESYSGWFDETDPTDYTIFHSPNETCGTIYMNSKNWSSWYLHRTPYQKFYLQTDTSGAKTAASLFPIAHRGVVRYFRLSGNRITTDVGPHSREDILWSIHEATSSNGMVHDVVCTGTADGCKIVSANTPFLNSMSGMIGVETDERYRSQGLARRAVGLVISRLLELGRIPVYASDVLNLPSMRIANSLFEPYIDFEFMFVGKWTLDRPAAAPSSLPDSLFLK